MTGILPMFQSTCDYMVSATVNNRPAARRPPSLNLARRAHQAHQGRHSILLQFWTTEAVVPRVDRDQE